MIPRIELGNKQLKVSKIGFGAGQIGDDKLSEDHVGHLLNYCFELGLNIFDSARGYGLSEERIGRHLSWRRNDIMLSTKVGYGIDGVQDWSYDAVYRGVIESCHRMRTSWVDMVHLHSCSKEILQQGDVLSALERAKSEGLIRCIAYSGENEDLSYAVHCGRIDVFQFSSNVFETYTRTHLMSTINKDGAGMIGKRTLGNAPWRFSEVPVGNYAEGYWHRLKEMQLSFSDDDLADIVLRYGVFHSGVHCSLIGSTTPNHVLQNIQAIERGPLSAEVLDVLTHSQEKFGQNWEGLL